MRLYMVEGRSSFGESPIVNPHCPRSGRSAYKGSTNNPFANIRVEYWAYQRRRPEGLRSVNGICVFMILFLSMSI